MSQTISETLQVVNTKRHHFHIVSAAFQMVTISLISMSLVDISWFSIKGGNCMKRVVLSDYFTCCYGQSDLEDEEIKCLTWTTKLLLRLIIGSCLGCIVISLSGFFLDLLGAKSEITYIIRKYSLTSCMTVLIIMGIICMCYYVALSIEESLQQLYPNLETIVSYGLGFYIIAATGGISLLGTFCSIILKHSSYNRCQTDEQYLIDNAEAFDTFQSPPPPPPYNIPPPPYTP